MPPCACLELAAAIGDRAGEGAAHVAEQLALDQLLGNRRAVHLDERRRAAAAQPVDVARHQLLAGAVLTDDEHPPVGRRRHRDLLAQLRHRVALADHLVLRVHLGAQRQVLGFEMPLPQRVADHEHRLLERERLLDEVEGAHLDRAHRRLDVAVAGDDHDLRVDLPLAHPRQRRESVHARQPDVEHDHVVGLPRQTFETRFAALDGIDVIAFVAQHAAQRGAHAGFIVNDQNEDEGIRRRRKLQWRSSVPARRCCRSRRCCRRARRRCGGRSPGQDRCRAASSSSTAERASRARRRNTRTVVGHDDAHDAVGRSCSVSMSIAPRRSIASIALSTRLITTRRICS